uniref:Uncharacterized protein n=1 Tax=Ascaris lumbricoides TaxID=6252 RepID=A0A0M3IME9_ASCLU
MSSKFVFIAILLLLEPTMLAAYWGWGGYRPYGFGMYGYPYYGGYYGGYYPYGGGV